MVPPSLPMQMAFAVNTALMSLLKTGIYCTEPFRVPYAGRVSHCFFDKTGTLTSDQMVAVQVVNQGDQRPVQVREASAMACVVLAGCHSLIEVDNKLLGDPIEVAALSRWPSKGSHVGSRGLESVLLGGGGGFSMGFA